MRTAILMLFSVMGVNAYAMDIDEKFDDPEVQARYETIISEVRCLVCQNQTIADSSAPLASDLRREIRGMVEAGQSDTEIMHFLIERYGDFVLYRPRFESWSLSLWLAPFVLLLLGLAGFAFTLKRRAGLPINKDAPQRYEERVDEGGSDS
ncbi:MAG: cytochrome c-type biogenesis protein [Gammaproteobacteria bacterium]